MGMLHWEVHKETGKGKVYASFLTNLFKHYHFQTNNMRVIQDNSKIHKTDDVRAVFRSSLMNHRSEFLPPYSPQLNMIESVFSQMQAYVNQRIEHVHDDDQLIGIINDAARSITPDDCSKYYNHVVGYYTLCRDINYMLE